MFHLVRIWSFVGGAERGRIGSAEGPPLLKDVRKRNTDVDIRGDLQLVKRDCCAEPFVTRADCRSSIAAFPMRDGFEEGLGRMGSIG